jgi:small subunit ribosomal protein S16
MLKIKLTRIGKRGESHYRIIVAERRSKRDGRFVASLGYYSPQTNPATVKVDRKLVEYWVSKGAQMTPTIKNLLKTNG